MQIENYIKVKTKDIYFKDKKEKISEFVFSFENIEIIFKFNNHGVKNYNFISNNKDDPALDIFIIINGKKELDINTNIPAYEYQKDKVIKIIDIILDCINDNNILSLQDMLIKEV